ncbi:hypothetical protein [Caldimonas brevitalea]|uniref:hypothetical protein n=1 Tax=Caldimonas brevitalea TaxID=413882 RepID=UPI0012FC0F7D|nr:hypothetical protein [Caldimonas brevitalea]
MKHQSKYIQNHRDRSTVARSIPAMSWRGACSPLLLIPLSMPFLSALFAPADVLDAVPVARALTEWVQQLLPFVNMGQHADSTTYPQPARLTHSLSLLAFFVMTLVFTVLNHINYHTLLAKRLAFGPLTLRQHLVILLGAFVFLASIYAFVTLPGDPSFARGATSDNRVGFAILTVCLIYPGALCCGAQLLNIRLFFDTHARRRTES